MAEDGYSWRKFGQKQSGENSRSYYYCTYPNCKVKRNVEYNADGVVTMIVYKGGDHKHSKPDQPDHRQFNTDVMVNTSNYHGSQDGVLMDPMLKMMFTLLYRRMKKLRMSRYVFVIHRSLLSKELSLISKEC